VSLKTLSLSSRLRLRALKLRQQLVSRLMSTTAGHDEMAVVVAMTLGDKSLLTKDVKDMYSVTAASHVLALSGLHLSILYGVIMLLLAPFRRRLLVQVLLLTTIWTYAWLVGLSPSVVRAATMLSIYSIVTLLYRDRVSFNVLAFSAILLLIISPHSLLDVGFQLSYLSVAAILLFVPLLTYAVRNTLIRRWRLTSWLYDLLAVSVAAQLGTAPLVAYYFGRFSCLFLLSSLFAVPLVTLILWVALLFFLTAFLPAVQLWIGSVLTALARLLNGSLAAIASIPGASIEHLRPSVAQVIGCYILILVAYTFTLILLRRHVNRY
jgi:competence protein ComEC